MFGTYFYNETIKRAVSIFGTCFNNITVKKVKADGTVLTEQKVPISYGPKQKFLERLAEDADLNDGMRSAISLPRLAFEIAGFEYDATRQQNKLIRATKNTLENTDNGKRSFQYTFKMMPRNQAEADEIRKIIFAFKSNMLPEFLDGNRAGRRLTTPNTFDIQYMYNGAENQYLHKISTCVCTNVTVAYGGDRYKTYSGINGDGAPPIETTISLTFKEIDLITREKAEDGF